MRRLFSLFGLVALVSVAAYASDTCTGGDNVYTATVVTGDSDNLGTAGGSCTMDGYTFSNFDVYTQTGFTSGETFSLTVTTDSGGTEGLLAVAYSCGPTPCSTGDFIFTYEITPGISEMTLIDGTASSVTENVCSGLASTYGTTTACSSTPLAVLSVDETGSPNPYQETVPVTYASQDIVAKDVNGGSEFYQAVVPEPMTLSLMGIGLLGLGFLGRRIKK